MIMFSFDNGESGGESDCRMGLERLLRKLMRMNSKLAILNMHYHPFNKYAHLWDGAEVSNPAPLWTGSLTASGHLFFKLLMSFSLPTTNNFQIAS